MLPHRKNASNNKALSRSPVSAVPKCHGRSREAGANTEIGKTLEWKTRQPAPWVQGWLGAAGPPPWVDGWQAQLQLPGPGTARPPRPVPSLGPTSIVLWLGVAQSRQGTRTTSSMPWWSSALHAGSGIRKGVHAMPCAQRLEAEGPTKGTVYHPSIPKMVCC